MPRRDLFDANLSPGTVPFLSEAINTGLAEYGQDYEVVEVAESGSRKGYLIKTGIFLAYVYKSSPIAEILIEALQEMVNTHPGEAIILIPNQTTVQGFALVVDEDLPRNWVKSVKRNVLEVYKQEVFANLAGLQKRSKRA
jgi:hypothetical protein